jgi:uncharacterized membrane protein
MISRDAATAILLRLGRVLTWGNRVSTGMLVIGAALFFIASSPIGVAFLRAGLVTLLATPVARVVVATAGFLRAREWASAVMSGSVLAILIGSVFVALS